ncbi:hypothetical protein [Roseivirga sp.]|uniref:hypothetical protein n=1 Tax=Roseivirga sp. TaxID=1964215 RepID=UPI002B26F427|nr:hypothetical protein [Roseivirga sp.]
MKRIVTGVILISLSAFSCKKGVIVEPKFPYTLTYTNSSSALLIIEAIYENDNVLIRKEEIIIEVNQNHVESGFALESERGVIEGATRLLIKYNSKVVDCSDPRLDLGFRQCLLDLGTLKEGGTAVSKELVFTDETLN